MYARRAAAANALETITDNVSNILITKFRKQSFADFIETNGVLSQSREYIT